MSVVRATFEYVSERWGRDQVLGLAPDAPSQKAAVPVAKIAKWRSIGCDDVLVWGTCQGSGRSVYSVCVDVSGPAFHCSCPSRKSPCKHALALLLLWSDGSVPSGGARPGWAGEWLAERQKAAAKPVAARGKDPRTAERREQRVDDGIADLSRWLRDQVAHGLAAAERAPYSLWDDAARRLVDAQAGALAGQVKGLAAIPRRGERWPQRLLEEYGLLHLLTRAHERRSELPDGLQATIRTRVGLPISQEEVLSGPHIRDRWYVSGLRDSEQDGLITRRVWLRGVTTSRSALLLSFGAPGRPVDSSMIVGTVLDASLAFFPGAQPLRALVADRHSAPEPGTPPGTTITTLLDEYATALSRDPWLDRWPAVLSDVRLAKAEGLHLVDASAAAIPLLSPDPWRLLAISGGTPVTVTGEWTPAGLYPLTAWHPEEGLVTLP